MFMPKESHTKRLPKYANYNNGWFGKHNYLFNTFLNPVHCFES
jgi:hypothetical protein